MAFQLIDTSESPVVVSGITIPDFDEATNAPTSTGIGTTLQTDDIVIIVHTAERRGGGTRNVEPAGANGAHPTGYSIATSSGGTSLGWSWTSIGNATSGNSNGNAEVGVGAYYYQVQASDTKTNVIATLTHPTGTGLSPKNFSRVLVLRGVDFVSTAALASNARSSRNPTSPTDNGTSGPDITWNQPSTTTGFWDSGDFPNEVLGLYIGSYRNSTNIDPAEATAGGVTRITSTAVSNWHTGELSSSTTESTTPAGFSTNLRGHVQIQLLMKYADFSAADFTTRGQSRDGTGNTADQASLFIPFNIIAGGTDHAEAFTDSATVVDTVTQTKSVVSANQDTSNASDALSAVKSASFTATDTSETSDSLSVVKSAASSSTDTSEASDILGAVKATTESNTDTSEASDSLSATIVKTSESTDASSAIDSATLNKSAESTSIEPATSIDSIVLKKTSAETITDTGSSVDVVTDLNASSEQKTDSASSVDSLIITQTHNVVETDSASIEDASIEIQTNGVTASDESQVVDSISVLKSFNVIITDISTSVDSIADVKSATQVNTDQSTSIDPIVLVKTHNVSQTDNVALEDNLTSTKQDQSIVNETDGATSQDALVISSTFNVVATDTNTSVDSIVLVLSHSEDIVDQSTTSDDPTIEKQTQNTVVNVTDSSTGVDSVVSKLDINESKIDPVTVEDLLSLGLDSVFTETDQSGAVDEVSLSRVIYFPSVTDPVSSSDTLDISVAKAQDIVDSGSGVDALTRKLDYELELSDSGEALDEIVAVLPEKVELQVTITGVGGITPNLMTEVQALATIDVWNVALNALGISTLESTAGSNPQQTLLNNTFPLFRKQFLSDHLWNGAKKTADLTALTVNTTDQAVANRWKYVYQLPTDCMRVWRLNGQENKPVHVGGNANIYTNRWEIEVVEVSSTKHRALCTNEDEARIEYVFDVGNDVDLLGPLTQHAMGMALAAFVATNFGKSATEIAQLESQAKDAITAAKGVDGQEGTPQMFGDTSLLGVRSIGY